MINLPSFKIARAGLAWVPEGRQIFASLTVEENLLASFKKEAKTKRSWRLNDVYELFPRLAERKGHFGNQLSGGEQQRMAVARALINKPALVFADEPSGNLDTENATALHQLFFELRSEFKQSFVIVTHNEGFTQMADRCLRMKDGQFI